MLTPQNLYVGKMLLVFHRHIGIKRRQQLYHRWALQPQHHVYPLPHARTLFEHFGVYQIVAARVGHAFVYHQKLAVVAQIAAHQHRFEQAYGQRLVD